MKRLPVLLLLALVPAMTLVLAPAVPHAQESVRATRAEGAVLRGLDRVNGQFEDYELQAGGTAALGPLSITLLECRYPADNPAGDAFAHLNIAAGAETLFRGWMLASSPALNAMDHPRYDVWVLRCTTS